MLVGDGASYPAIADPLRRCPEIPATVLLEEACAGDAAWTVLPERESVTVQRLPAEGSLVEAALSAAGSAPEGTRAVVALEGAPTRALSSGLRKQLGMPKERVHAVAYWKRR